MWDQRRRRRLSISVPPLACRCPLCASGHFLPHCHRLACIFLFVGSADACIHHYCGCFAGLDSSSLWPVSENRHISCNFPLYSLLMLYTHVSEQEKNNFPSKLNSWPSESEYARSRKLPTLRAGGEETF